MILLKKIITSCTLTTLLISSFNYTEKLGTEDCSGIEWGLSTRQGHKKTMEDRHSVETLNGLCFFGVYDGHKGSGVVEFVQKNLHKNFFQAFQAIDNTIQQRLLNAFLKTDKNFLNNPKFKDDLSGTTAVVAVVDPKKKNVIIANTGDSRAIVVRDGKVLFTTKDHKPGNKLERNRIEAAGGLITSRMNYRNQMVHRVRSPGLPKGSLAMSRAFGQRTRKHIGIIVDPDIETVPIQENDILVLACDGLWDVMTNQEVADFVNKKFTGDLTQNITEFLLNIISTFGEEVEEGGDERIKLVAKTLRNTAYREGSRDNISILIIKFTPTKSREIALPQVALQKTEQAKRFAKQLNQSEQARSNIAKDPSSFRSKNFITKIKKWGTVLTVGTLAILASFYLLKKYYSSP